MNDDSNQPNERSTDRLFTWRSVSALSAVLVLHAITLHLMGRIAWCECGFGLWTSHAWSSDTSQMLADPYSFTHVVHGIIFYAILRYGASRMSLQGRLLVALLIEVAWEVFEN